jgi:hypothetical protein
VSGENLSRAVGEYRVIFDDEYLVHMSTRSQCDDGVLPSSQAKLARPRFLHLS